MAEHPRPARIDHGSLAAGRPVGLGLDAVRAGRAAVVGMGTSEMGSTAVTRLRPDRCVTPDVLKHRKTITIIQERRDGKLMPFAVILTRVI